MLLRALIVVVLVSGFASKAEARVQRDVRYRYDQVWNALVRLIRVDHRFPIDEGDRDNGFVLFRFREYGRDHAASVEVIRVETDGGEWVRLVVQVDGVPTDTEVSIADGLETKLRSDYGPPRAPANVARRETPPLVPRLSPSSTDGAAGVSPNPGESTSQATGGVAPGASPLPRGSAASTATDGQPTPEATVSPSEAQPEFPPPSSRRGRRR